MKYRIRFAILAAVITNVQGAVIATNTFTGITGNTTTSATSAWTSGPAIGTASLGSTFIGTSAFRAVASVDGGANLSSSINTASASTTESLSFTLATGASSLQLGQFSFQYFATTGQAGNQAALNATGIFNLTITGGITPINVGPINVTDFVAPASTNGAVGTFNIGTTLDANTAYTFTLGFDSDVSFVTFDNFTLDTVPEPSAALLAGLGVLGLLRRRR